MKNEKQILRIAALVAGTLLGLTLGIWLLITYWPVFVLGGLAAAGYYCHRKLRSNIKIAEGVTVRPEALSEYLDKLVAELEWEGHPEIIVNGSGENLAIKLRLGFTSEPSEAADFHSRVIYLQGYIARRLNDDFRMQDVKVEIEAGLPALARQPA